jgi:hypothetical protein
MKAKVSFSNPITIEYLFRFEKIIFEFFINFQLRLVMTFEPLKGLATTANSFLNKKRLSLPSLKKRK